MSPPQTALRTALDPDGRVAWLTLDGPKGNVLTTEVLGEFTTALAGHEADPRLKLVVVRGAGGQFSYGAAIEDHTPARTPLMLARLHAAARAIAAHPVPVAALVEGRCVGGALELAICCHFVLATRDARFACPEIRLGVLPPLFAVAGALRLGGPLAERMVLAADELDAASAAHAGLVAAVLDGDAEAGLRAWYAERLGSLSAFALREATRAVRRHSPLTAALGAPLDDAEREYLARLLPAHDPNEGIRAFLERRTPQWRDA